MEELAKMVVNYRRLLLMEVRWVTTHLDAICLCLSGKISLLTQVRYILIPTDL